MRTRNAFGLGGALLSALILTSFAAPALAQDDPAPSDDTQAKPADTAAEPAATEPAAAGADASASGSATTDASATASADEAAAAAPAKPEEKPAAAAAATEPPQTPEEAERDKATGLVGVELLPGSAYPEPRVRGIKYGSLWLSMQGQQWPYMPWSPGHSSLVLGLSGSLWADLSYAHLTSGLQGQADLDRWAQQDRAVVRGTPTYSTKEGWFAQGQVEMVSQGSDFQLSGGALGQVDDLYLRVGKWNLFDLTVGRFQGWELYHYGMGLDLNTLERAGADDPGLKNHPPQIYGADYFWDRPNGPGNYAIHFYPTNFLRAEVLGQVGSFGVYNYRAIRPVVIFDLGFVKAKFAAEWGKGIPQNAKQKQRQTKNGLGGALQFVLNPYVEGGVNFAEGYIDEINTEGVYNALSSTTTRSFGGFLNFSPAYKPLVIGLGADLTHSENLAKNGRATLPNGAPNPDFGAVDTQEHFQAFAAIQYTLWEHYYVKFVLSHANFAHPDNSETPSTNAFSNTELGGRLRFMMLF